MSRPVGKPAKRERWAILMIDNRHPGRSIYAVTADPLRGSVNPDRYITWPSQAAAKRYLALLGKRRPGHTYLIADVSDNPPRKLREIAKRYVQAELFPERPTSAAAVAACG